MATATVERDQDMAKKKSQPVEPVRRNDVPARIDADVLEDVRLVAAMRHITIAEYLSEVVGPIAKRDAETLFARRGQSSSPKSRKPPASGAGE